MATPPNAQLGDIFNVTYIANQGNQDGQINMAWYCSLATGLGVSYQSIVNTLDATWKGQFPSYGSTSVTYEGSIVHVLNQSTGLTVQVAQSTNASSMGQDTTGMAPRQAAAVCKKSTTVPGRKGRGRLFVPFLTKGQITATGELTSTAISDINLACSNSFGSFTIGTGGNYAVVIPGILQRSPLPLVFTPLVTVAATGLIGTQKRRGDYGRLNLGRTV